jgi:hypothetical protein
MTAIIRKEAEALPGSVPPPLAWVIERLMTKEPSERYDSTRDLYRELKQLRDRLSPAISDTEIPAANAVTPRRTRRLILGGGAIACLLTGAALALIVQVPLVPGPDLTAYRFTSLSRDDAEERSPRWSPDGKSIVYTARVHGLMQVFTRLAGGADGVQLTRAESNCFVPVWSPDGATVYYVSGTNLFAVPASGGSAQKVFQGVDNIALHPDGTTLAFERDHKLWIGSLRSGEVKQFGSVQPTAG